MKSFMFALLLLLVPFSAMSQKVIIKVIKLDKKAVSEWQIRDEQYWLVFSGNDFPGEDSISFPLEANKRYFLEISVSESFKKICKRPEFFANLICI